MYKDPTEMTVESEQAPEAIDDEFEWIAPMSGIQFEICQRKMDKTLNAGTDSPNTSEKHEGNEEEERTLLRKVSKRLISNAHMIRNAVQEN